MGKIVKLKALAKEVPFDLLFAFLWILVATTGVDYMVTGKINPEVERPIFLAYVAWQIFLNQGIAVLADISYWKHAKRKDAFLCFLIHYTITWIWWGGTLDFLYFMMKGEMPSLFYVWHWILPWWTTFYHIVYTFLQFIVLLYLWLVWLET